MVECTPGTVRELITQVDGAYPGFAERVTEGGELRRFVNVFVAGEDVRFGEGIETAVADGQDLTILPAVAGGSY
jgi:molybdopterin converting factor small subunit